MFALIDNNQITKIGELQDLFPSQPNPSILYATQHGAREIIDGHREDERFYYVTFDKYEIGSDIITRKYINTPKALDDYTQQLEGIDETVNVKGLKSYHTETVKSAANSLLSETDWMVIRKLERNIDIPADVVARRAAIIAECDRVVTAITTATDMESFIEAVKSVNWN
jgi:hypothetical protein